MSDQDSGDKSELPTAKKLRDARKKGDVAKSKDVGAAAVTVFWWVLIGLGSGFIIREVIATTELMIVQTTTQPFNVALNAVMSASVWSLIKISLLTLLPIGLLATFVEFAQIGPIATSEKLKPAFDKMNPVEGLKKMFGKDGLVEMVKTLLKALLVVLVVVIVLKSAVGNSVSLISLANNSPVAGNGPVVAAAIGQISFNLTMQLFGFVVIVFIFVAILDRLYTQHSFMKKMMMSMQDIKKEHKDDEGDPHIKGMRRQMHEEFANQGAVAATGGASALLVNPTHIAIALDYDAETCPVPAIAAKGAGAVAAAMRAEAERMGVPIIRNIATARSLWARGEVGEIVPEEMFDAIAEVILWAKKARDGKAPMWNDMDTGKRGVRAKQLAADEAVAQKEDAA
jgi:type III secretion protein U